MVSQPPIVLVGPTHPYTGGIAQHTTRLALELERAKVPVVVESWKAQYPKAMYPGTLKLAGEPEIGVPNNINETLTWYSPLSWWRVGRRHRGSRMIVSIPTAFHALPYTVLRWGAGKTSQLWGIVHNVTPHDSGRLSKIAMGFLLRSLNRILVYNNQAREEAVLLGVNPDSILVLPLPSPWPENASIQSCPSPGPLRAIFFGIVRPYKGLDLLLHAMTRVEEANLIIAGEFWEPRNPYDELISRLGLSDRVMILPGYVPAEDFEGIFSQADVMVLPYRRGTGSIVKDVAFRFGLPVIATRVGAISDGIDHDVNGLVISPGSVEELADALRSAGDPATLARWRKVIAESSGTNNKRWADYVTAITSA